MATDFYRAMLCISEAYTVMRCLSVCLSVCVSVTCTVEANYSQSIARPLATEVDKLHGTLA